MKLFYFLDFLHVKSYGSPVTFDNYVHLEHGPIPSSIKNLVDNVADDIDSAILSDTIAVERVPNQSIQRIVPTRKLTTKGLSYFTPSELEIIEKVCLRFGDKNTEYIEDASHDEAPWKMTDLLESIPYMLAVQDNDCQVTEDEIKLLQLI